MDFMMDIVGVIVVALMAYVAFVLWSMLDRSTRLGFPYLEIKEAYRFYRFKQEAEKRGVNYEAMMAEFKKALKPDRKKKGSVREIEEDISGEFLEEEVKKKSKAKQ